MKRTQLLTPFLALIALCLPLLAMAGPVITQDTSGDWYNSGTPFATEAVLHSPSIAPVVLADTTTTPAAPTLQVVGLVMTYTDDAGQNYPASFWQPVMTTIDAHPKDLRGSVVWYGWVNAAAFQAGKATIAQHTTQVGTPDFLAGSQQTPSGSTMAQVIANMDIYYAMHILDTDTGQKDANGKSVMRAFFAGATPTTVTGTLPTTPAAPSN